MNLNMKLLAALILGSTLAACGGSDSDGGGNNNSSSSSSSSDSSSSSSSDVDCEANPFDPACVQEDPETEIDITTEAMPLQETFTIEGEGNQIATFFSPEYKRLNTEMPQTLPSGEEYEDPYPSFYYPTCCMWMDDPETGERTDELIPDIDSRQYVGTDSEGVGFMAFSNARYSIGQLEPDIISDEDSDSNDAKTKTTNAPVGSSWGELDLSKEYRISFCLKDAGRAGAGTGGNFEVYVDNNSGGNQGHSIHGNQSLLMRTTAASMEPGNRVVIDVPGDVRTQDNNGDQVTLLSTVAEVFGTETSFLQFRVSSGGYAVISDLMIEYQDDLVSSYTPCVADDSLFEPPLPEGYAFPGLPLNETFEDVTKDEFIGDGDDVAGQFMGISSDVTIPFYRFNSTGRLAIEEGNLRMTNNRFTMGFIGPADTAANDTTVSGDIDLSVPYTVTFEIAERPASDEARLQVLVDNNTTDSTKSMHGESSVLLATTWAQLGTGTLEINVPGDVLLNNEPVLDAEGDPITIDTHVGTASSFLQVWCPSDCGDADTYSEEEGAFVDDFGAVLEGAGVTFSSWSVEEQPDEGGTGIWTADSYVLAGGTTDAEGTLDAETADSITITATGGKSDSSSDLNFFFASQQIEKSDFAVSARIASVEGATVAAGNGRRFGLMVISDLTPAGAGGFDDLGAWAGTGFYAENDPVELIGSRAYLKPGPGATRSRSNISDLAVGDYVRIEIYDDGEGKRVRHCTSSDGTQWVEQNSTSEFKATAATDTWHYGAYAAPGDNEVTMTLDNITVQDYTEGVCVAPVE